MIEILLFLLTSLITVLLLWFKPELETIINDKDRKRHIERIIIFYIVNALLILNVIIIYFIPEKFLSLKSFTILFGFNLLAIVLFNIKHVIMPSITALQQTQKDTLDVMKDLVKKIKEKDKKE